MKNIKLIMFDLDGCMVHTQPDIALAVQATAREVAHKDISLEVAGSFIGGGTRKAMERMLAGEQMELLEDCIRYFKNSYVSNSCVLSKPYPGVSDTLAYFKKAGVLLAVATAKLRSATENVLRGLDLYDYFDCIICDEDMTKMKPDPECIITILGRLNVAPEHAVYVGDMKTDVQASRAAGVTAVAVSYGYGKLEDLQASQPDYLLDDITALERIVEI